MFVFNPFTEGYIANGRSFTPVKHQAAMAEDLANLPQFLCGPGDYVLVPKQPSPAFLQTLKEAGFPTPQFVPLAKGRIAPGCHLDDVRDFRPWAWGPDSVELLMPLFSRFTGEERDPGYYYNEHTAPLYSKAWSALFLRRILARSSRTNEPWLCSENEAGIVTDTVEQALEIIASIRSRGHHPVVLKEAHGLAGHNAIRLLEPEILPVQEKWLAHAVREGRHVVVEPWLDRELDFSIQLEMGPSGLAVCGYTGLINDRKGQFLANWAEADYRTRLPAQVASSLGIARGVSGRLEALYESIFAMLEAELRSIRFVGPISIDAFVYRGPQGQCLLKPVVEINPRYTMGRLTCELMQRTVEGTSGLFRLWNRRDIRAAGYNGFCDFADSLHLRLGSAPRPGICQGTLCLNDPAQARVCLATFHVNAAAALPRSAGSYTP